MVEETVGFLVLDRKNEASILCIHMFWVMDRYLLETYTHTKNCVVQLLFMI